MTFLKDIISPVQNCEEIAIKFCKQLNLKVTETTIKKDLLEHPDYPSLLSISDVFRGYGVDNLSLKTTKDNLIKLPLPLIAQINGEKTKYTLFSIVNKINVDGSINWYNPELNEKERISMDSFSKLFTGYVQIAETNKHAGELDYKLKFKREQTKNRLNIIIITAIPLLVVITSIITFLQHGFYTSLIPVTYTLLTLIGAITGALLLFYEVDQFNPTLQKVCHAGKRTNCAAILNSTASKIFGISWSSIGFAYFAGVLFALILGGIINPYFLFIAAWLNIFALPYVIYSLYYQGWVAKEWCPMCLAIQVVLVLQFMTTLIGGFQYIVTIWEINANNLFTFIFCFLILFIVVQILIPPMTTAKESISNKMELQRLKHNPQIFNAILTKQKQLSESTEGLGLTLGNVKAKIKLIKVCSPYCGPCSNAHSIIEDLLNNNSDIQLQIIFAVSPEENDYRNLPVKHFLTINQEADEELLKQSLNDWYLSEEKDYEIFKHSYPIEKNSLDITNKIRTMHDWCNKVNITFTPTFFINGYQLPEMYTVSDLRYFLSV